MTKATPKSCSCGTCRQLRGTDAQHRAERHEERAFRHHQNELARQIPTTSAREWDGYAIVPAGTRGMAA